MKSYRRICIFVLASIPLIALSCADETTVVEKDPATEPAEQLRYLVLEGSPFDQGVFHGRMLKEKIHEVVEVWKSGIAAQSKMEPDVLIEKFLDETDFIPSIEKWTPGLLREVNGIAQGSGIDFDTILAFQFMDELWFYLSEMGGDACSGIGIARQGDRPSLIAQNMDLETFRHGYQVLLHIKDQHSERERFVFTCAGLVALNGLNSSSVGVCVNTLAQLRYEKDGLPVAFVVRGLLRKTNLEDAVEFIKTVKHASGQNYIIGGLEGVVDFEASAGEVVSCIPDSSSSALFHTNHPLASKDFNPEYRKYIESKSGSGKRDVNTKTRLRSLEQRLRGLDVIDIGNIKSALSAKDSEEHPVCRAYDKEGGAFTFGSTVMVLSENPELHVAPGPPDVAPFQVFRFTP